MTLPDPSKKMLLAALAALALLHAIALSSSRLLPFTDLPNHLAASTIVRHYGEFGNEFSRYFEVDLFPKPNVLHIAFCSSKVFPSVEAANRAWYFLYALLLPFSVLLLIRRLGGSAWPALFSPLLLYSYSVCWGFAGYTMAVPLVLLSAWASAGIDLRPGLKRYVASAAILLLLFFAHALAALFAMLLHILIVSLANGMKPARRISGALTAVPAGAMLLVWWLYGRSFWIGPGTSSALSEFYSREFFSAFPNRWKMLYIDNYAVLEGGAGEAAGTAASIIIIIAAVIVPLVMMRRRRRRESAQKAEGQRIALIFLATSLACALFLPKDLPGQAILAQRFSVFVLLSLAVLAGVLWKGIRPRLLPSTALLLCAAHLSLWWANLAAFNRENEGFTPGFLPTPWKGRVLAGLVYDYKWRGWPAYIHFPGYYITWKKGIATTSVIGYRFGAVRRKAPLAELPAYLEWTGKTGRYDNRYMDLDYILMRGALPEGREYEIENFTPLRSAGAWHLLKND